MTPRPVGASPTTATLSNPKADRVKGVKALAGRSARLKAERFLVEGPQAVREAVAHAPQRIVDVYVTEQAAAAHPDILAQAQSSQLYVHVATEDVVHAMSADAQGIVAVARTWQGGLEDIPAKPRLIAVLSHVRDPGNAGTVIRVADAAGADAVVLVGDSVDIFNPKVVRSSVGSLFHLPVITGLELAQAAAVARERGMQVWATDGSGTATLTDPTVTQRLSQPTAWVFGNEAWGLSDSDLALCDDTVRIPILGKAESLNLASAASVCLYASALAVDSP